jgi:hypothetical protein
MLYATRLFVVAATIDLGGSTIDPQAFQLPDLVTDTMKAIDDLGEGAELQLVFDLLRVNDAITQ